MIFNVVGGGGKLPTPEEIGAMSMELLWENASPTSDFAGQQLSFDWGESTHYMVEFSLSSTADVCSNTGIVELTHNTKLMFVTDTTSGTAGGTRLFTADTKTFGSGIQTKTGTTANANCIPVRIYGIKGVK